MCLAVPGRIVQMDGGDAVTRTARVRFGGIEKTVNVAFTPEAAIGDYVLVHVGFAIGVLDEEEARRVWIALEEIGGIGEVRG